MPAQPSPFDASCALSLRCLLNLLRPLPSGAQFPQTNQGGWLLSGAAPEAVHQFSPEQVPIHIKLAQEFGLFDNYHTSFPGPSTPNHLYLMTGTNAGCTSTGQDFMCVSGKRYPQKTIFESLAEQV